jgi:hypothetical protein
MATKKKPVGGGAPEAGDTGTARTRAKTSAKPRSGVLGKSAANRTAAKPGGKAPKRVAKATPKTAAKKKAPARKTTAKRVGAGPRASGGKGAAARTKPATRARGSRTAGAEVSEAPRAVPGLSEEDQIRAAKFLPRELPKRLFEEERFLFPESYGQNRIRLLVRDPEWIFAYWDVKPQALEDLAKSLGERALALSRLTLRVVDPVSGGASDILLPPGARWWYVKTDAARRTYRAELGVTLPSGQFRKLAESNTVVTPRVGPSPEGALRRMSYRTAGELAPAQAAAALEAERTAGLAAEPWAAESVDGSSGAAATESASSRAPRGGASDAFRPGGASDTFRR